jgi:predicted glycosyltransferase
MARNKDVVIELLEFYKIPFKKGSRASSGIIGLSIELISWFIKAFITIHTNKIDIAVSLSSPATAWAAKLQGIPHIMFNDTEPGVLQLRMARPATKKIYTPECLLADWGKKQIRYKGIHQLSYLSPPYFIPPKKIDLPNKSPINSEYAVLRFVSWNAVHDWGRKKITNEFRDQICAIIQKKMRLVISAEGDLPEHLEKYRLTVPPHKFHDLMAKASIVVGDGATTAAEAAVMGIPSIYISPFAETLGYCRLLHKYGLLTAVKDEKEGLKAVKKLIDNPDLNSRKQHRDQLLQESCDVVEYIVERIKMDA